MGTWVCATCGNHFPDPRPEVCTVCADERQWVPPGGQRWTTLAELTAAGHRSDVRAVEPGLTGIGADPPVAIGQRSLLVTTGEGNLLWDPSGFIDAAAVARCAGGRAALRDRQPSALLRGDRRVEPGVRGRDPGAGGRRGLAAGPPDAGADVVAGLPVLPGVTLVQCGGHFPGSAVRALGGRGGRRRGAAAGDTIFVTPGEDRLTFVLRAEPAAAARGGRPGVPAAVRPPAFDRIYSGWWTPVLRARAWETVRRSALRYIEHLNGTA